MDQASATEVVLVTGDVDDLARLLPEAEARRIQLAYLFDPASPST